jgi:hypothetical protein
VFDTDFIHRNLFTGLTIERQNHENVTRFILGETGVRVAQRIADINSELRTNNRALRDAEAGVFSGITDVSAFVRINETRELQAINQYLTDRIAVLEIDKRLAQGLAAARIRIEPTAYNSGPDIVLIVEQIERGLSSTYQQAHLDAEARLADHLQNHTRDQHRARNWLRQGRSLTLGNDCPFCGQALMGSAEALINAYQSVFDEAFERYVAEIVSALDAAQRGLASLACLDLLLRIEQNRLACAQYPEVFSRPSLTELLNRASTLADDAIRQQEQWTIAHTDYTHRLAEAIQHKRENAHAAAPVPDAADLLCQKQMLTRALEAYNEGLMPIITAIAEFKAGLDAAIVERRIHESERDIASLRLHKRRIETDAACRTYSEITLRKAESEAECVRLQIELEREQTAFLTRCFETVNRIYSALGSNRFTISAETSRRGNMPTIQLRVAYNRTPITPDKLHRCFSESDRRALAFAIFWARIEMRDPAERANTIVVMDDPVTSFDDARIDRTIRLIELQAPNLRQTIVLSHYSDYLKTFFNRLHGQHNGVLLATLFQDANGSQMRRADPLDFTETDHQRAFRRISTFIERAHTHDVFQDLRVYLETEVRSRFYMIMSENNLRALQFAALLDELTRLGSMSADTRRNIEPLRVTLNTDHHIWTGRRHEEKIGVATDVLRFIYQEL